MSCYLDQIPWTLIVCLTAMVAWGLGAAYTGRPSEDEMLHRLIEAEASRRLKSRTTSELKAEIETAAEIIARRS
jgi:hypothetical protein